MILITANSGCFKSPKTHRQNNAPAIQDFKPAPFAPSDDSIITPAQFSGWFACNSGLDSLSIAFTNSVIVKETVPCDSTRLIFCKVQDRICVQNGLKGGYAEYSWIANYLGNSKNKPRYDSMNLKR
jgi:hypothetical protein